MIARIGAIHNKEPVVIDAARVCECDVRLQRVTRTHAVVEVACCAVIEKRRSWARTDHKAARIDPVTGAIGSIRQHSHFAMAPEERARRGRGFGPGHLVAGINRIRTASDAKITLGTVGSGVCDE